MPSAWSPQERSGRGVILDISITIEPAATRVSLLARAMTFPAPIAAIGRQSPLNPTIAATTMSTLVACNQVADRLHSREHLCVSAVQRGPQGPCTWSRRMTALLASNSWPGWPSAPQLPLQVSISTLKKNSCAPQRCPRVCLPIEPVEPSIAILSFYPSETYIFGWIHGLPLCQSSK